MFVRGTRISRGGGVKTTMYTYAMLRDENSDPVGYVDYWPVKSGSVTFFIGSGSYL